MQRSSPSIASLAAALAKAQIELTNPEKSQVAIIQADAAGLGDRSFRYSPLSAGLDIVRKVLGEHEIATLQTTAIDQPAGIINLTTVLAHASGEWIASDWPVCAVAETSSPHRMSAALAYARRYELFTLVGIAGEDDLDAPDLQAPRSGQAALSEPKAGRNGRLEGGQTPSKRSGKVSNSAPPLFAREELAGLRDRLVAELQNLGSADEAALWAHQISQRRAGSALPMRKPWRRLFKQN